MSRSHHFRIGCFSRSCFVILLILSVFSPLIGGSRAFSSPPIPEKVRRIVFLGNSITYSGQYVRDIEAYFTVHYPNRNIEFINVGLSSETVSGLSEPGHAEGKFPRPDLHERLERVLAQTKPDLVFACYGMNDGIYMPFDEGRFQKYKDGIHWMHDQVVKAGVKIVHLTPPVYDELKGGKNGYDKVLDKYSTWLLEQRKAKKWKVVDIHGPMKKYLEEQRKMNSTFSFAADGVHPDDLGHWIMAKQVLMYLGEKEVADAGEVKATMAGNPHAEQVIKLVEEQQALMRDAWLTATGHKRPGVKAGLPLKEAEIKAATIENQIRHMVKE
ncbi:MAG: SGNH/GDSL hydrolase family protein [Anditalea sp.]